MDSFDEEIMKAVKCPVPVNRDCDCYCDECLVERIKALIKQRIESCPIDYNQHGDECLNKSDLHRVFGIEGK